MSNLSAMASNCDCDARTLEGDPNQNFPRIGKSCCTAGTPQNLAVALREFSPFYKPFFPDEQQGNSPDCCAAQRALGIRRFVSLSRRAVSNPGRHASPATFKVQIRQSNTIGADNVI
jgi:hypothetical protein